MRSLVVFVLAAAIASTVAQNCPTKKMTPAVRAAIVNEHNHLRSRLAKGLETTHGGRRAPSARNMYKLVYDCDIEKNAQAWADNCTFKHSPSSLRNAGENLYMTIGSSTDLKTNGLAACAAWWSELVKYGISDTKNRLTKEVFKAGVGHFTQMAWGKTTRIGCGIANNCKRGNLNSVITVCQYREMGNYLYEMIYELGTPCKKNADCTTFAGSRCSVAEGLCVKP